MVEKYFITGVMCKACKYSQNMAFYKNTYSCKKHNRLFVHGDSSCPYGELVNNPYAITADDYVPQGWKECDELTAKRNTAMRGE